MTIDEPLLHREANGFFGKNWLAQKPIKNSPSLCIKSIQHRITPDIDRGSMHLQIHYPAYLETY